MLGLIFKYIYFIYIFIFNISRPVREGGGYEFKKLNGCRGKKRIVVNFVSKGNYKSKISLVWKEELMSPIGGMGKD